MLTRQYLTAGLLTLTVATLAAGDAFAERIRCSSRDYRYAFCGVRDQIVGVRLVKRHSKRPCTQSRTWGWQRDGIWVDDGCDADFEVSVRPYGPGPRPPLPGPPVQGPPPGANPLTPIMLVIFKPAVEPTMLNPKIPLFPLPCPKA